MNRSVKCAQYTEHYITKYFTLQFRVHRVAAVNRELIPFTDGKNMIDNKEYM